MEDPEALHECNHGSLAIRHQAPRHAAYENSADNKECARQDDVTATCRVKWNAVVRVRRNGEKRGRKYDLKRHLLARQFPDPTLRTALQRQIRVAHSNHGRTRLQTVTA